MGELVTTTLKHTDSSETVMQTWTQDLAATRASMFSGIKTGDKIMMAFAKARAMQQILKTTQNERLKAELLIVTDPDVAMVELAHNPTPEDRVRICAIACMTGFVPGSGEYGIFGGGKDRDGKAKPGKLFVKEPGYRTLFAQLGCVAHVEVDHPEYVAFGTSGKKVWRIAGRAYVDVADQRHEVTYEVGKNGIDFRLGISGYESDIIASVTAKARRQMLKQLWSIVSPMLCDDHADEDDLVPQEQSAAITEQPRDIAADNAHDAAILEANNRKGTLDRLRKILKATPDKLALIETVYQAILDASDDKQLKEAGDALAAQKGEFSQQVLSLIRPVYESRLSEMKAGGT